MLEQMLKYAKFLKEVLSNKRKLVDNEKVMLTEECNTILQRKLPPKLKDPRSFTIPCTIGDFDFDKVLCDLGANVNMLSLSIFKKLELKEVKPTMVSLKLADRSIKHPRGIIEDVLVMKFSSDVDACFAISVLDRVVAETFHETFPTSPIENFIMNGRTFGTLCDDDDIIECVNNLEALPTYGFPKKLKFKELEAIHVNNHTLKKEPPKLELKLLPSHLKYAFLEDSSFYPIIINSSLNYLEEEKLLRVLREHRKAIGWTIDDIKGISPSICMHKILFKESYKPIVQPQRRLNPSMQEVVKKEVVKLLDASIIYPILDCTWVSPVQVVPKKGRITRIEVDRAKIDVIEKLPPPTNVKGLRMQFFDISKECLNAFETLKSKLISSPVIVAPDWELPFILMCDASGFAIGAILGQRKVKIFHVIYYAIKVLRNRLYRPFDFEEIKDKKGTENLVADNLSRMDHVKPNEGVDDDINEIFPNEQLFTVEEAPWYADIINYLAKKILPPELTYQRRKKFFSDLKYYIWDDHFLFKQCVDQIIRRCVPEEEMESILHHCHSHYISKWVEAEALQTNDARVVVKFLKKNIFARFGTPRAIISDRGFHFCNSQFESLLGKYRVTHRITTPYHPQTSGQVEAYRKAFKTLNEMSPYKLVYGKSCHLSIKLEYKSFWAVKFLNFDLQTPWEKKLLQLNEMEEFCNNAYENAKIYKDMAKRWHDKHIQKRNFEVGQQVLLFNSRLKHFPGEKGLFTYLVKSAATRDIERHDGIFKLCIIRRLEAKPSRRVKLWAAAVTTN
ncbi:hypothetical protein CK203_053023 [Vitis vinifera]|uniref:Integrase catalytic domain-containing protein n=1 Tax=Vitis vinifera TaxID=29760 RepID=A0A438FL41_VITVI|nr:hypothetical protein CK203_053023 [Vitis vinifera]